eukprot:TRINITY_DN36795_c0_g1_i2.p1 TRINITY_DN36795_c0_g1~~TRINITY_DN36795_c0_g1_i2.p1  ORF type:complete len:597 (-),score=163.92 TRINITY_DN36795_c0_g1_i2:108-1898(-)
MPARTLSSRGAELGEPLTDKESESDLESEDEDPRRELRTKSWPFPLRICPCLPGALSMMVPVPWQVIQDWTHVAVIAGLYGSISLLFESIVDILDAEQECSDFCIAEGLAVAAVGPTFAYITSIVASYDEQIHVKKKMVEKQKKVLVKAYEKQVQMMDELLGKAAESSATMAERGFESKRRDFIRFLDKAATRYQAMATNEAEHEMLLQQFRRFVLNWLAVFAECSVDPQRKPKVVVTDIELRRCKSIGEAAALTIERLKAAEVRFISVQQTQDAQMLRGLRMQCKRMSVNPQPLALPAPVQQQMTEIELTSVGHSATTRFPAGAAAEGDRGVAGGSSMAHAATMPNLHRPGDSTPGRVGWCGWMQYNKDGAFGCGRLFNPTATGYPKVFQCRFWQLIVLTGDHSSLLIGLVLGLVTFFAQGLAMEPGYVLQSTELLPICGYLTCISVLLLRFEEIDVMRRLEIEIGELKTQSDRVEKRREEMMEFWQDMQTLTDLWVHRTVPRLDLLKELQGHLDHCPQGDALAFLATTNARLENLEACLPALGRWRGGEGALSEESQKAFAETMLAICREDDFSTLLHQLGEVTEAGMPALKER